MTVAAVSALGANGPVPRAAARRSWGWAWARTGSAQVVLEPRTILFPAPHFVPGPGFLGATPTSIRLASGLKCQGERGFFLCCCFIFKLNLLLKFLKSYPRASWSGLYETAFCPDLWGYLAFFSSWVDFRPVMNRQDRTQNQEWFSRFRGRGRK